MPIKVVIVDDEAMGCSTLAESLNGDRGRRFSATGITKYKKTAGPTGGIASAQKAPQKHIIYINDTDLQSGTTTWASTCLHVLQRQQPDIFVCDMDLKSKTETGTDVIRAVLDKARQIPRDVRCVALSQYFEDRPGYFVGAVKAGALGFSTRDCLSGIVAKLLIRVRELHINAEDVEFMQENIACGKVFPDSFFRNYCIEGFSAKVLLRRYAPIAGMASKLTDLHKVVARHLLAAHAVKIMLRDPALKRCRSSINTYIREIKDFARLIAPETADDKLLCALVLEAHGLLV